MPDFFEPLLNLLKAEEVAKAGYILMTAIVFVETGLLVGFCLPGDSLLITAGMFASNPEYHLNIVYINLCLIPAAICGDSLGYWIGRKSGPLLFRKEKSLLFNPKHLVEAHEFYERHGGKAVILARYVPIVRTFMPVVAGLGRMPYRRFLAFSIAGSILWVMSVTLAGFYLGRKFPWLVKRIDAIVVVVVVVSVLPMIIGILRKRAELKRRALAEGKAEPEAAA